MINMILVDDSGWGSLLGSVAIGVYDTDIEWFHSRIIPIKYFQGKLFSTGKYRDQAWSVFRKCIISLDLLQNKDIVVCRGTCLDTIYNNLCEMGKLLHLNGLTRKEIGNPLQSLLEARFAKSLMKFGVPEGSGGAHCLSFDDQLKWVKQDKSREKYVKTGWSSWVTKYGK